MGFAVFVLMRFSLAEGRGEHLFLFTPLETIPTGLFPGKLAAAKSACPQ